MVTKEEINGYFLEAVRRLKAQGYSQKDIVKAAGLSPNAISKIKTGQNNAGDDTINKLCATFNLNPDFFYRGSQQFTLEEKTHQSPMIDPSSAVNAAIAAYAELTNLLKQEMADRLADKDTIIAEKQSLIESLERTIANLERTVADKDALIRARDARILELERRLAQSNADDLSKYPFAIGAAEDQSRQQQTK